MCICALFFFLFLLFIIPLEIKEKKKFKKLRAGWELLVGLQKVFKWLDVVLGAFIFLFLRACCCQHDEQHIISLKHASDKRAGTWWTGLLQSTRMYARRHFPTNRQETNVQQPDCLTVYTNKIQSMLKTWAWILILFSSASFHSCTLRVCVCVCGVYVSPCVCVRARHRGNQSYNPGNQPDQTGQQIIVQVQNSTN